MDPLRLIILLVGLLVIAGIYLRYREPKRPDDSAEKQSFSILETIKNLLPEKRSVENDFTGPDISLEDVEALGAFKAHGGELSAEDLDDSMQLGWDSMTPVEPKDECILVFNILAKPGEQFRSGDIKLAADANGFFLGSRQIFDYRKDTNKPKSPVICSFVNAVEPGHFAALESAEFSTPGISLFAQLPGPLEARETFKLTLDKAHDLASSLGGILCDESRSILSEQTVSHLKEKVEAFRFKQKMAAMKQRRH